MIAWFTKNHVAANLLMITILLLGLFSLKTRIPLEVFPTFESEVISVSVSLRGATPEDVEQGVAIRVEEAVQDLEGIKRITSRSVEGSTRVSIEVDSGYDARDMLADIKNRVDGINTLPRDSEKPITALQQRKREVIAVTVSGEYSEQEIRELTEQVRDDLLRLSDVTQVEISGVRNLEISIETSPDKLRQYGLTLEDISNAISRSSLDVSAGNLRTDGGDVIVRSKGQAYRQDEFEQIVVKYNSDGSIIRLSEVASVNDGFEETLLKTTFNGEQAALIDVYRIGEQSAIQVADAVKKYIEAKNQSLPEGFKVSFWDDDSEIVKGRLNTLISNAMQGGFLVLLLLTLFLRPSIAFWVFIGIPISFLGAFTLLPMLGVSLNIMSLFGFILVLGIVVDDAIVTGENVYRHLQTSESGLQAAINGTREVAVPVTFGVLTTVAAFLPLAFIEGRRGAFFAQIPMVVIPVLLFSLIESKFVLPAHLKYLKLRKEKTSHGYFTRLQHKFADGFESVILKYYQPVLKVALNHKLATVVLFTGVFTVIVALIATGWTKFTFFPRIPSETARANLTMPVGTPFEVIDKHVDKMANAALDLQEKYRDPETGKSLIMNVLAISGGAGGASRGRVRFEMIPADTNDSGMTTRELVAEWRRNIGKIPGAESLTFRAEIGRGGDPVDVQLSSTSFETLEKAAEEVKSRLATYPEIFDISDSMSDGKDELQIEVNTQGAALGLTSANISQQVRQALLGSQTQRIQRGRDDIRVIVRLLKDEREAVANVENLLIKTPTGATVPLSHVADLIPGQSPSAIYRIDRYRTVNVTADIDKDKANMTVIQNDLSEYLQQLVVQYPGLSYKLEGEAREQRESFGSLGYGLVFVFFIIYCLLAIPFKSYIQPIIVMSVIPFGAVGAIIGHWIMGMNLTIFSLLGLMALIGVVVNDSLVLVDFINKKRVEGNGESKETLMDAVLVAGAARFRPVMLTSLTTFFGLMPLLFEKATQAQFLIPMAVSLAFGILFATLITLILVPVNYLLVEKLVNLFSSKSDQAPEVSVAN